MAQTTLSPIPHGGGFVDPFESYDSCYLGQGKYLFLHGQNTPYDVFATIVTEDGTVLATQVLNGFHTNGASSAMSFRCIRLNSNHFSVARFVGGNIHVWALSYDSNHVITQKGPAITITSSPSSSNPRLNQRFEFKCIEDNTVVVGEVSPHPANTNYHIKMGVHKLTFDGSSYTSSQILDEEWTQTTGFSSQWQYNTVEIKKCVSEDKWVAAFYAGNSDYPQAQTLRGLFSIDFSTDTVGNLFTIDNTTWNNQIEAAIMHPISANEVYFFAAGNQYHKILNGEQTVLNGTWGAGTVTSDATMALYLESHVAGNDDPTTFVYIVNNEYDNRLSDVENTGNHRLYVGAIENGAPVVSPATVSGIILSYDEIDNYSVDYGAFAPAMYQKITESKIALALQDGRDAQKPFYNIIFEF